MDVLGMEFLKKKYFNRDISLLSVLRKLLRPAAVRWLFPLLPVRLQTPERQHPRQEPRRRVGIKLVQLLFVNSHPFFDVFYTILLICFSYYCPLVLIKFLLMLLLYFDFSAINSQISAPPGLTCLSSRYNLSLIQVRLPGSLLYLVFQCSGKSWGDNREKFSDTEGWVRDLYNNKAISLLHNY